MNDRHCRVAVVGGGITGLAAAHRLGELAPHLAVDLYESAPQLGGILQTEHRDGFLIERSADMFTTREPWAVDLCRRIGLFDQLLDTNPTNRRAFVVCRGRLVAVPEGFTLMGPARIGPILRTPLLSWTGKLRLAAEYFVPRRRDSGDESLRDFAVRRCGQEAYERLIQPLIGGIYTADPTRLSMAATMAQFVEMERDSGSLIRGMRRAARQPATGPGGSAGGPPVDPRASGARYGLFVAPREGMSSFVAAVAARLGSTRVHLGTAVAGVQKLPSGQWQIDAGGHSQAYDGLILALPAPQAALLARNFDRELASGLSAIEYAGAAVVVGLFRLDQFSRPIEGFGFVAPQVEHRQILSASYSSVKFAGRAPTGTVIVRVFLGGACQPEMLTLDDDQLRRIAWEELAALQGLRGAPLADEVVRWNAKMPQYHVGHVQRIDALLALAQAHAGLALAGNAYRGVGIPFCVHSGEQAAEHIVRRLAPP